jgi:hypothetical protein
LAKTLKSASLEPVALRPRIHGYSLAQMNEILEQWDTLKESDLVSLGFIYSTTFPCSSVDRIFSFPFPLSIASDESFKVGINPIEIMRDEL